uniref:Uncharacterized protein n=1 Tax=Periophthalmus magnuspinnatus TaxID=409849 RepID=A0A3B4AD43_9GOBI
AAGDVHKGTKRHLMLYLFRGREDTFTASFTAYHSNMRQFLSNLESCAEQMEKMNKGANVSGVVHSSVATAGGVMSILGILAAPFTAGASLGLLAVGTGLGVASTVTSVVTDATELGVNETELQKAQKHFSEFMDEAQKIQSSLEKIIEQHFEALSADLMKENSKIAIKAAMGGKNIHKTLKYIKKFRALRAGQLSGAGLRAAGQTGKALMKGAFALVSVGWGIYSIVDHSKNLSKGPETEASRWIRARVALWRSEFQ